MFNTSGQFHKSIVCGQSHIFLNVKQIMNSLFEAGTCVLFAWGPWPQCTQDNCATARKLQYRWTHLLSVLSC
jgi:hypothetical protein